jgi:tetratricopeptide (TPR) repeat protein
MLEFDTLIKFTIASYYIQITLFTFLISIIILILIIIIIINILSYIFKIPRMIKEFFLKRSEYNQKYKLMEALFLCIINDNKSIKLKNNLDKNSLKKYDIFYKFIEANIEKDPIIKITKFKKLEHVKIFLNFSLRKIMQIFYDLHNYKESIIYASRLYAINERDIEALDILIYSYASLKLWKDFLFFSKKRLSIDANNNEIMKYYIDYINNLNNDNNKEEAIDIIEYILKYWPNNVTLLELYCELNDNINQKVKIVKQALSYNNFDKIIKLYENNK